MVYADLKRLVFCALTLLICPLTIVACVSAERFPQSWSPVSNDVRSTHCDDIVGIYENGGENGSGGDALLAIWLDPAINHWNSSERTRVEHELRSAQWVQLTFNRGVLEVSAIGVGIHRQWTYDYVCRNGRVHIPRGGDMSGDNVAVIGSDSIDLGRADNHLIVERHGGWLGVALLIPVVGYDRRWARFQIQEDQGPDVSIGSPANPAGEKRPL